MQATGHRPPNIGARIDSLSVWHEDGCPAEFDDYPVVLINWDDADAYARWDENNCRNRNNRGADSVAPVYAYPEGVSGYGTWNQSGNVMEWCSVWREETDSGNASSDEESLRQERGGCWRYPDKFAFRSSQRSFVVSKAVNDFRGFRLVLPVEAGA